MKKIVVMTLKGGVAKTVTATTLAYILGEERKKKVLLVDADQQGNASMLFSRYDPTTPGLAGLLDGEYDIENTVEETDAENVDIIPANGYIMQTNMNLLSERSLDQIHRFRDAIEPIESSYDYCIVDCGLLMDMTVTNVMVTADLVIVPVKVGGFEIDAIQQMEEQLEDLRTINPKIEMKVLMTMKQRNKTTEQVEEWLRGPGSSWKCFKTPIRRSIVVEKATMAREPLPEFAKNCAATKDYREVVEELLRDMEE